MRRVMHAGLVAATVLVALTASEFLLRASGYRYSPVQIGDRAAGDWRDEHAFQDRHLIYDPKLIWRPLSGQFSPFNPQGFRGAPIDPDKRPEEFRIFALGDSNTFGWDVDEGANWPTQLQRLSSAARPGVEVINAGVWGYSSFQGVRRFHEILAFNPDLVLVSFGANDAHRVRVPDAAYVARHDRLERLTRATRQLRLAQLTVAAWDRAGSAIGGDGPLVPRVSVEDYVAHLREITSSARARHITVVLMTRPFVGSSTDPESWKTYAPAYNTATLEVARAERVPVIDLYTVFAQRPELFDDESHFGVEGHRVAAEVIHAALSPLTTH
ncbi:MAG: SGNH/GDSL hydrolase family protein [Acidobacteriota bacterium]